MKNRAYKWAALISCGAMLMQVSSCAALLADTLLQQVFAALVSALVAGIAAAATTTTG